MTGRVIRVVPLLLLASLFPAAPAAAQSEPTDTLTFDAALAAALARDPRVAAAGAGVDAASAVSRQARAAWLPSLVSSGALTRYGEPMVVAPLHGFDPTSPPEFDRTLVQGRVTAAWTIFDGGARRARMSAAAARVDGAGSGAAQARMDATLELLDAWLRTESTRDAALAEVGEKIFRIWRIYMAGSAYAFERGWLSIFQVLAARPYEGGATALPLTRDYIYPTSTQPQKLRQVSSPLRNPGRPRRATPA